MTKRSKKLTCGWCQSGVAHKEDGPNCPRIMRAERTVVTNLSSGTRITEMREILCDCNCGSVADA